MGQGVVLSLFNYKSIRKSASHYVYMQSMNTENEQIITKKLSACVIL